MPGMTFSLNNREFKVSAYNVDYDIVGQVRRVTVEFTGNAAELLEDELQATATRLYFGVEQLAS